MRCGSLWLTDVISNVVMFVPFGVALGLRRWSVWYVLLVSLIFSAGVETMQYLGVPPGRSPALADILTNTVGGMLGAQLVHGWRWQRVASHAQLSVLALAWSAVACAVVAWSGYMLTPVSGPDAARATGLSVAPSAFEHVPGLGWYEGLTDSAFVGTTRIKRGWSGPVIQQMAFEQLPVTAGVTVRGSDRRVTQVPLLFVHLPNDSSAWLQIAKSGDGVELTVLRRARQWGLRLPSVIVPRAFAERAVNDARPLTVTANVTTSTLRLQTSGTHAGGDALALTPLLGWTLIQPIFTVHSPLAWLAHAAWLLVLIAPIGWCAARSARPFVVVALCGAVVCAAFVTIPIQMGLSPLPVRDWGVSVLCLGVGFVLGWRYRARRASRSAVHVA